MSVPHLPSSGSPLAIAWRCGELCGVRDGVSVCVSLPWAGRQVPLCIWDLVGLLRSVSRAATMEMRIAKI